MSLAFGQVKIRVHPCSWDTLRTGARGIGTVLTGWAVRSASTAHNVRDKIRRPTAPRNWPAWPLNQIAVRLEAQPVPTDTEAGDPTVQICYF